MKKTVFLLTFILISALLVGCGNKTVPENTPKGTASYTVKNGVAVTSSEASGKKKTEKKKGKKSTSETSSYGVGDSNATKGKEYPDADVDFTGKVTIVGRWHCVQKITNGEVTDQSSTATYYIFSSDMTMDNSYNGQTLMDYHGYELSSVEKGAGYESGKITMYYGQSSVTIGYTVEVGKLTLYTLDGSTKTIYERAKYY